MLLKLFALIPCVMLYLSYRRACKYGLLITIQATIWLVLFFTFSFPFFIFDIVLHQNAIYLFTLVYVSLIYVFFIFNDAKWMSMRFKARDRRRLNQTLIDLFTLVFLAILSFELVYIIYNSGGIVSALTRDRLSEYLGGGILKGSFINLVLLLPTFCYFVKVNQLLESKERLKGGFLISFFVVYYIFIANTRLPILMPIVAAVVFLFFTFKSNFVKKYGLILCVLGILGLNILMVFGNALRGGL